MGALDRIVAAPAPAAREGRTTGRDTQGDAPKTGEEATAFRAETRPQSDDSPPEDARGHTTNAALAPALDRRAHAFGPPSRDSGEIDRERVAPRDRSPARAPEATRPERDKPPAAEPPAPRLIRRLTEPTRVADPPVAPERRRDAQPPSDERRTRPGATIEVRREHVVRERVIERTVVERLLSPTGKTAPGDDRALPARVSTVERPSPAGSPTPARDDAPPSMARPSTVEPRSRPEPTTAASAPRPAQREAPERHAPVASPLAPRPEPRRDALRPAPEATERQHEGRPSREREAPRARAGVTATTERAPATRARPIVDTSPGRRAPPPAIPAVKPAPRAEPRPESRERAHPPARTAAAPRVQISIGRVEVRGKEAPPAVARVSTTAPRAHQIDPGLPFGSLDGARI